MSTEMWLIIGAIGAASILIVVVAAKSKKKVKKRKLDNIKTEIKGDKLLLKFNITKELGKSSTEKTIIVANSHGDWSIKGTNLSFGMFAFKYPKKKAVKEKPEEIQNIDVKLDKNDVTLKIDIKKNYGPSSSGKSIIIASTRGNKQIKDTGIYLGLNVYKLKKK